MSESSEKPACNHTQIDRHKDTRTNDYVDSWVCRGCGMDFAPTRAADAALAQLQDESDRVIDMATAVFSAVLWDLHERAFERHGIPHRKDDPVAETVCEETGHSLSDETGSCTRCGHSPFLGGGS